MIEIKGFDKAYTNMLAEETVKKLNNHATRPGGYEGRKVNLCEVYTNFCRW